MKSSWVTPCSQWPGLGCCCFSLWASPHAQVSPALGTQGADAGGRRMHIPQAGRGKDEGDSADSGVPKDAPGPEFLTEILGFWRSSL